MRSLFSPPPPCAKSMAQEFRCLRAAIRAARPHLANIFEKLLDQKTFVCLRLVFGKPFAYGSARLGHIPSLPWESQLPLKPCPIITTSRFYRQLRFFRFCLRFLLRFIVQFCYLLRKCGLLAHTSAAFLKNCWSKKLFVCLRLVIENTVLRKTT